MSTTDQAIMETLQYRLLELPDLGATWPSGLWTQAEVLAALNERQDRMLKASRFLVGIAEIPVAASTHRFKLPDDWLSTVDAIWLNADKTTITVLERSDSFEADHGIWPWPIVDTEAPVAYMDEEAPSLIIQIAPAPIANGTLQILYVPQGPELDGSGEQVSVPDEYARPALMYGALADLLGKDGRGRDLARAAYCELRYRLGLDLAKILLEGWV